MNILKRKLNLEEQIEYLKDKGVKFSIIDEKEAKDILMNRTYYFKIKSYSKNYEKDNNGKYIDLEFAYLVELSKLDMYLRRILLDITLDVEHTLKTSLLRDFNSTKEDGYKIVCSFLQSKLGKNTENYLKKLATKSDSSTSFILASKYKNQMPIWVLIEIIQLHDLMNFYKFFYAKHTKFYTNTELNFIANAIFSTKCLRNLSAHNNCIIKNIFENDATNIQKQCIQNLAHNRKHIEANGEILEDILKNQQISDFYMMILLMNKIVKSLGIKNHIKHQISEFFKNKCMTKTRRKYFLKNNKIKNRVRTFYKGYLTLVNIK